MDFEYDPRKSLQNYQKHGIDFVQAQKLWNDPHRLQIPARTDDEPRFFLIGKIGNKHWSVIFTLRLDRIRIISARRSRDEEVELYESKGL